MRKIDIVICLKRRKKRLKECQKNYREAKKSQYNYGLNSFLIVIVTVILIFVQIKQFLNYDLIKYAIQLNIFLYSFYFRLAETKSLIIHD